MRRHNATIADNKFKFIPGWKRRWFLVHGVAGVDISALNSETGRLVALVKAEKYKLTANVARHCLERVKTPPPDDRDVPSNVTIVSSYDGGWRPVSSTSTNSASTTMIA